MPFSKMVFKACVGLCVDLLITLALAAWMCAVTPLPEKITIGCFLVSFHLRIVVYYANKVFAQTLNTCLERAVVTKEE